MEFFSRSISNLSGKRTNQSHAIIDYKSRLCQLKVKTLPKRCSSQHPIPSVVDTEPARSSRIQAAFVRKNTFYLNTPFIFCFTNNLCLRYIYFTQDINLPHFSIYETETGAWKSCPTPRLCIHVVFDSRKQHVQCHILFWLDFDQDTAAPHFFTVISDGRRASLPQQEKSEGRWKCRRPRAWGSSDVSLQPSILHEKEQYSLSVKLWVAFLPLKLSTESVVLK